MPTIDRFRNCRVYFWSDEGNEPPHVHVDCAENTAKIWLHDVSVAYSEGFDSHEFKRVLRRVREGRERYLEAWNEYFGGKRP